MVVVVLSDSIQTKYRAYNYFLDSLAPSASLKRSSTVDKQQQAKEKGRMSIFFARPKG